MWELKEALVLDVIEAGLDARMAEAEHRWYCSAAQITGWDPGEAQYELYAKHVDRTHMKLGRPSAGMLSAEKTLY